MKPELIIDGYWLSAVMPWGDLEWVTCWPGGTESITFDVARSHPRLFRPGALVELDYGGIRLADGSLVETSRGEPLLVEGLHRKGEEFPALDSAGALTTDPEEAVTEAIASGLPWDTEAIGPLDGLTTPIESDAVLSISQLLDHWATLAGQHWGVLPGGRLARSGVAPATLHMLPGIDGLAISRDGYASILIGRFLNSFDNVFYTTSREDAAASARWGQVRRTITEPLGGGAAMSSSQAWEILDGLLVQGRASIGWATPLEAQPGDVVNEFGQAVDPRRIAAGQTIRLHGLDLDVADLSGQTWVDVPIARTRHKDGAVTIEPRGLSSPMNDALAAV